MSNNGSPETGQHLRALRDEWRHRLRANQPQFHCPDCSSICFGDQNSCTGCGANKPSPEWPKLADGIDPWLGEVIDDRYIIARPLGEGSSGQVYRAESLSISRQFAVKIISTDGRQKQADQVIARLQLEIEALSRLRNPHIVSIYELVELRKNFVAAVMDLIEGRTLEQLVTDGEPLTIARAATLLRQTANGIYGAHQAGMIHRDLKPENLMVERLPVGDDFVHILDFGIVRLTDEPSVNLTQGFIGTPLYASPEQAMAKPIDHRSDIYSLGAILFFMLTGRSPFVSDNVYEVLRMHVKKPAPMLSDVVDGVSFPPELEDLTQQMLAKDPADRPADLSCVIDTLDRFVRSQLSESEAVDQPKSTNPHPPIEPPSIEFRVHTPLTGVSAATPEPSHSTEEAQKSQFASEDHTSSATLHALGGREPVHTPPFLRSPTPVNTEPVQEGLSAGMTSVFNPRQMGDKQTAAKSIPVATYELRSEASQALASRRVEERFAILDRAVDEVMLFESESAAPSAVSAESARTITALDLCRTHLVFGHQDGTISQSRIQTGASQSLFQDIRRAPITALAVDDECRCMVAGSESGRVYLHRKTGRQSADWKRIRDGEPVSSIILNGRANTVIIARSDRRLEVVSLSNPRVATQRFKTDAVIESMAISSDDYLLAAALANGSVALFEVPTGRQLFSVPSNPLDILNIDFSDDGHPVAISVREGKVALIQLQQIGAHCC